MSDFHYNNASVGLDPKSQPPATINTHQTPTSTVRSEFSSWQKTSTPTTLDNTQPSQSAPHTPDQKHNPPPAACNSKRAQRKPSALESAEKPVQPPSIDSNNQPPPASQGAQLDTTSQVTPHNAQKQGPHHSEMRPGSNHYDIHDIVVNVTYNVTPPQTPAQELPANPTNCQQSRPRSQPVHIDDASQQSSRKKQAPASSKVRVFCSLIFAVEWVNIAFFAYYVHAHKAVRDDAYTFGIGFLITLCLMTGITLLDMVNAFCAKNGCWYVLSACFWGIGGVLFLMTWFVFLIMYSVYWSYACPMKYPADSNCQAILIAPVWIFNLPLFVLIPIYVFCLSDAAEGQ